MKSYPIALPFLRQEISAYSQCAGDESWKQAHEESMACRDLEALLQVGLGLFRSILKLAPEWRGATVPTNSPTDQGMDSEVFDLVQWWVRPCENVDAHIRRFEGAHYAVDGADEFRGQWEHARGLLAKLPTTWRGQRIYREAELKDIDFPFPPEPE